ncbi:MAG TPA: radical SAM protein [Nitrospirae bacterium]|nr:antilisterial bacteriocin subtilosin biosynthesis protein AlbA [bacterium BMS3Abin08]HDO36576.1 radical SAM protein [Nitrospirota bacterium]HDY70369.1 radical SAM protein [Nitrospirota bacterium]
MKYTPLRHLPSVIWKKRPIQFTFFVTRRCNARCPFCFYLNGPVTETSSPELGLDEIRRVADSLGSLLWLSFSGGEVYLREDIVEITRVFYERCRPSIILLSTNALLPETISERTEEILRSTPKSTVVVKLSLDGDEGVHDRMRGVKGAYAKVMETYEKLRCLLDGYSNFELGINTLFSSGNQGSLEPLIEHVKSLDGIKTHTVSLIRGQGLDEVDMDEYFRVIRILEKNLKTGEAGVYRFRGAGLKAAQDILQRRLIFEIATKERRTMPCYAGRLTLVMTEGGDVFPCEAFNQKLGNIRDCNCDIREIIRSERAKRVRGFIKSGGCLCSHECYLMMNILFNMRMYPAVLKEYLALASGRD